MSRNRQRNTTDQVFALVRLVCPAGHVAAQVLKQHGRYSLFPGAVFVESPGGEKIKCTCRECGEAGLHRDVQASWPKVRALLDEIEPDHSRGVVEYRVG